jgi:hypothetical protein
MGMAAGGGDAGIDRLSALSHYDQIIDHSRTQGPKDVGPGLRQGTIRLPECCWYR